MTGTLPRISFGMIVLNGEPFTRYNLRALYPWAHQIIVVEGACPAAVAVAGADGHSTDGTLQVLRRFQAEEDPEGKLLVVTAEDEGHPDGFWPGEKDEMSRAYARRATGDYLWQVDVDEFYRAEDMPRILEILASGADAVSFPTFSFWGGAQFVENGEYFIARRGARFDRLFAWGEGYRYAGHRPPTVLDRAGVDTRHARWVRAPHMERAGVYLYHYSMLLPKQVRDKCSYYSRVDWAAFQRMEEWAREVFFSLEKPFAVCNSLHCPLSWLEPYDGGHPAAVIEMLAAVAAGAHPGIELRETRDIAAAIGTRGYRAGRLARRAWVAVLSVPHGIAAEIIFLLKKSPFGPALRRLYRRWHQ